MLLTFIKKRFLFYLYFSTGLAQSHTKIDPALVKLMAKGETPDVVVSFVNGNKEALSRAKAFRNLDRAGKSKAIKDELVKTTEDSQKGVLTLFKERSAKSYTQFWISNTLLIKGADYNLITKVAEDPQVSRLRVAPIYRIPETKDDSASTRNQSEFQSWNFKKMEVFEAWRELGDNRGKDVIVAHVDTGVSLHNSLKHNFRGDHGWYDPVESSLTPIDGHGHGTATMSLIAGLQGTIVGWDGTEVTVNLGVAPDATWMACRACGGRECSVEAITKCYQWLACPTLADGTGEDCSKVPHILSLSLVTDREPGETYTDVLPLVEMGVIVVAAVGNDGNACETSKYPANGENIIGVGGVFGPNYLWSGSSRGPTVDGRIKPDVVAPAKVHVASATNETLANSDYGTSYAAPAVAGVVALLRVRDPELTWDGALKFMADTADPKLVLAVDPKEQICGNHTGNWNDVPNNVFGWGCVNALKAVQAQTGLRAKKAKK